MLFRIDDPPSQSALRTLIARRRFDPDLVRVAEVEAPPAYEYWGARLLELHEELENLTPRGRLWTWAQRKSGARYVSK